MKDERTVTNERVDDIPVLMASQEKMGVRELVNRHFQPHGHWQGISPGELIQLWLTYILSEGDHRLNSVEGWVGKRRSTLQHYAAEGLTTNDFRDDRLAIVLRLLSDDEAWSKFESALNEQTIRVYDLSVKRVRLDSTTASGHWQVTPDGLFQYGHSKDHRPDLPQLKVMLATLDPLGMPLVTNVVAGQSADDPLYLPAIAAVRQSLKRSGLLYIGDCKMASQETRATIAEQGDYYLCPLSAVQLSSAQLQSIVKSVLQTPLALSKIERTQADGKTVHIADAFEQTVEQQRQVDGKWVTWSERQVIACSHKYAASQSHTLQQKLTRAQTELIALNERKQGKPLYTSVSELEAAIDKILLRYQVAGLLQVKVQTVSHQRQVRKYRERPAYTETIQEFTVAVSVDQPALDALLQTFGWRCFVTNSPTAELSTEQAILAYREQFTEEHAFGRLKGKPLSLTPMYLELDDHATGLVRLLSLGLRILSLLEFSVRRSLQRSETTLAGLYAGNPKRKTSLPSAEHLLLAFKDLILTVIHENESRSLYLTPLSPTQSHILSLLGFDDSLYLSLLNSTSCKPP
jgi:transposase